MPALHKRVLDGGMEMRNAFTASPKCCPSRTALLSGRYPHSLEMRTQGWCGDFITKHVNDTFFSQLKEQGYRNGLFGKLINKMGPLCESNPWVPRGFDVDNGDRFVALCNEWAYYENTFNIDGTLYTTGTSPSDYMTSFIGNHTVNWLRGVATDASNDGTPFFAYIAPHAPHLPAIPAPWYLDAPLPFGHERVPRTGSFATGVNGKISTLSKNPEFDNFTLEGIDQLYRDRLRTLMSVDDIVEEIFQILEDTSTLQNTYVFFTSDHGYHLGNFGIPFEKSLMYDTDVRIPFYVSGPSIKPSTKQDRMVSLLDMGATILELGGATAPHERTTDGRSLVPLFSSFEDDGLVWRSDLLIEFFGWFNVSTMTICDELFGLDCDNKKELPRYIVDFPDNTWAMLRIINQTTDLAYTEYRPYGSLPLSQSTTWTEAYNFWDDPWQLVNRANGSVLPALSERLWLIANCIGKECP
eukprot:TRINITY_DN95_c0_g1_i1.p1 TRINITY_DN95_c0_g1~~TRINITY_DN95_c0_g1_i1.p1  ORF type:complete len:527 (-),score=59.63 TRINITY_DN95_c0_g1_i1:359-1762(-)